MPHMQVLSAQWMPFALYALLMLIRAPEAFLFDLRFILSKVGGVVVIIFGLHMIGVFHIPFLMYDTRIQQAPDPKLGYLSSALMGVFFSAGWSLPSGVAGAAGWAAGRSTFSGAGAALADPEETNRWVSLHASLILRQI